jgi:guanosine-3',5'-bis(diphosphate) 3'-pyrophosphohydrolase
MDFSENTGQLLKAIRFSADKHRNQRRKDNAQSPYINHPIEVVQLLWDVGGVRDVDVLLAAVLHDTIEDTHTRPEEIRAAFGPDVLSLVLEVTDDKSLPKAERKRLQIENWSLERRREYLLWTEQVVAGLRGTNAALEEYYEHELINGKALLGIEK